MLSSLHGLPVTVRIKPKSLFLACNSPQNHYLKSFIKLVHSSLVAAISHFWWLKSPQSEDFLLIQVQNFLSGSSLEQTPNIKYHNSWSVQINAFRKMLLPPQNIHLALLKYLSKHSSANVRLSVNCKWLININFLCIVFFFFFIFRPGLHWKYSLRWLLCVGAWHWYIQQTWSYHGLLNMEVVQLANNRFVPT